MKPINYIQFKAAGILISVCVDMLKTLFVWWGWQKKKGQIPELESFYTHAV